MNFDYTEEQNMLKDSVARFVQDQYDFEARCKVAALEEGYSADNWKTFAELGWLSIPFAEEHGGFGGNVVDTMLLMEELGKGLVLEPFLATVVLFGGLLSRGAADQQQYIGSVIEGSLQGAFAYAERQSRFNLNDVATQAIANGDGYRLNGEKIVVLNGAVADKLIVSARTSGSQLDSAGISLFLVDANAKGVARQGYRMMDGQKVANILLQDVEVTSADLVGELDQGLALMQSVISEATVAVGAEAVGIMDKLQATTVEYTKTREQFGVAIGSFQALQHRMVEMFMACEQTRSLLYRAACSQSADQAQADRDVLALKVMVGRAGKLVGDEAFQLHGGIGMTDELDVGHYVKRLMMINTLFGDADFSQQRFAELAG
ncbi:pimeloyl-CoA dehydrogenase small subunit [Pseudomaricurvus alkylphenolicus]|jgi:alkylation response protein AidB-like acyl-CoA dehydrogenase|uniref:acyl-CoA dehydrogenase family protein n=1 Tax=Pseudomaricurvus alkylphenolicus TaxID=1306991 RepID=UPI001420561C|nr:acyl-CoA dehydrogenase family protein [Pseudomaricurvus alkylphenolicus]NIB41968.1 pimeloyl-CoA dehydrogenase small subunit [Pseudomaricurvus alkylphenolicus]